MAESEEEIKEVLSLKQELFCKIYASDREFFGNGVESYVEAYNVDKTKQNWYLTAKASASRLLTNVNVLAKIREIMPQIGFNDEFADKELAFVMKQNAEYGAKVSAIREYNKLKKRVQDKLDLTTGGLPISLTVVNYKDNVEQVLPPPAA